ncbi:allantoin racemase [Promicromonospora sp. AC04]|uniref:aspartate/glutamate racemase family protein n=1 Tax=Promicromonospora sp. AC04 TaxID=2135723 RepID=UPI000D3724B3|nr:aspartate/glutamate racemase family protein [Promicromonospora sp. AC04]PUB30209.1 allantoin racemase [Promicromonospora sp. AC04]
MRIHLINPNTSRAMTDKIAVTAREVAGPDVSIAATCPAPGAGPAAVESHTDEAWAALVVAQQVAAAEAAASPYDGGAPGVGPAPDVGPANDVSPADGYVVACFGDPGLDAARELTTAPVVGIAEAAMHVATLSGRTFAVVTTLSRTLGRAHDLVRRYGFEDACVAMYAADVPVLDLEDAGSAARERIAELCERAVRDDGADTVVLGCAGMTDLCADLTKRTGVPVIDGVAAAVGLVSGMARMGAGTSKHDEYAPPPRPPGSG